MWKVCRQPASICELAPWLEWSLPWRPEVEAGSERMIMDWIYDCFPLVSEHFFCWRDEANFSLFKASIYPASRCSAGEIVFLISHGRCSLSSLYRLWISHFRRCKDSHPTAPLNLTVTTNEITISENSCTTTGKSHSLTLSVTCSLPHTQCTVKVWADLQGCFSKIGTITSLSTHHWQTVDTSTICCPCSQTQAANVLPITT